MQVFDNDACMSNVLKKILVLDMIVFILCDRKLNSIFIIQECTIHFRH